MITNSLINGRSISLENYGESNWYPQICIENSLGDLKEQIQYSVKLNREDNILYICEHRHIKGLLREKLQLQHFPSDVQHLSIFVRSMLFDDKVILIVDPYDFSGINLEAFVDQQEWSLYEHLNIKQTYIKQFIFRKNHDEDDNDQQIKDIISTEDRKRSILTITCHAAHLKKVVKIMIFIRNPMRNRFK